MKKKQNSAVKGHWLAADQYKSPQKKYWFLTEEIKSAGQGYWFATDQHRSATDGHWLPADVLREEHDNKPFARFQIKPLSHIINGQPPWRGSKLPGHGGQSGTSQPGKSEDCRSLAGNFQETTRSNHQPSFCIGMS
jgi:hypothetical protein